MFENVAVRGADEVVRNWESIKADEKKGRALLDSVPRAFPSLLRATRVSEKVSRVGFDWPDHRGSRDKVNEELEELDEAMSTGDADRTEQELGDVLFALVNLARHRGIDPEAALRRTTDKFVRRFGHVETRVREARGDWPRDERNKPTRGVPLEQLDSYWEEAKRSEGA